MCVMRGRWLSITRGWRPIYLTDGEATASHSRAGGGEGTSQRIDAAGQNVAGNAHRNYERWMALAREAASNGDIVEAERAGLPPWKHSHFLARSATST